ncbi:helix-turn-helix domain-containing protein [Chitinophaga flava]|uniref:HTH araC/xylS-type domain-containing protein n=1 Tax=Chitinophaga flava TaxID=2259036 RepID=A0A365XY97_9BACT|nr:helix-turn-helix domain-containing protein [Chitinophaga flava]RBL90674.1 hypothetical protein DF182_29945 [Chitinophaga flava]
MKRSNKGALSFAMNDYIQQLNPENDFVTEEESIRQFAIFRREEDATRCAMHTSLHRRGFYKISLISGGTGTFTIDGHRFASEPPMVIVSRPEAVMEWQLDEGPQTGFYTLFAADFYDVGLLPLYRLDNKLNFEGNFYYKSTGPNDAFIQQTFASLYQYRHQPEMARHCLRLLITAMLETDSGDIPVLHTRSEKIVRDFQLLVQEKLESTQVADFDVFSVKAYAALLNIDDNYLGILCRDVTGKSASAIIREKMSAEARFLLLGTDLTIGEIAGRLCFYDVAHFSRWFRKNMQLSPSAYREKFRYK